MTVESFESIRSVLDTLPGRVGELMDKHEHKWSDLATAYQESELYHNSQAILTVYAQAEQAIAITADHMRALERMITEPVMTFAPWTTGRSILSSSSIATWLLELDIATNTRVARSMTLRLKDLEDQKVFARCSVTTESNAAANFNEALQKLDQRVLILVNQAKERGVPEKRNRNGKLIGFGDGIPSDTDLAELTLNSGWTYRLLSAMEHDRNWASLALGFKKVPNTMAVQQNLRTEYALLLIHNGIEWFTRPAWNLFKLMGWDLEILRSVLEEEYDKAALNTSVRFWRN